MNFSSASFYFSPKLKALSCDTRRAVCLRSFLLSPFFFHSFTSATSVLPSFHPNFLISLSFLNFSSFLEASFHPSLWLSYCHSSFLLSGFQPLHPTNVFSFTYFFSSIFPSFFFLLPSCILVPSLLWSVCCSNIPYFLVSSSPFPSFCPCSVNPSFFLSFSFFTLCPPPSFYAPVLPCLDTFLYFLLSALPYIFLCFILYRLSFHIFLTLLSRCLSSFLSLSRSQRSEASRRQTEKHFTQSQISDISETPPAVVLSALKHRHRGIWTSSRCVYTAVRLQIR